MRSYICVRYENKLYKLVWMTEDKQGVYMGWYGEVAETHFSYHRDGKTHFKVPKLSKEPIHPFQKTSINEIAPFLQINYQAIPLYGKMMQIIGFEHEKEDKKSEQIFFVDGSLFTSETIVLDSYILNRDNEHEFVEYIFENQHQIIHLCALSSLNNFQRHKLAIIIRHP